MRSAEMAASERAADIAAIQESKRSLEAARIALNTPPLERETSASGVHTPPPKATAHKRSSADLDRDDMPMSKARSYHGHSRQNSRSNRMVDSASLMSALNREIGEGNLESRGTTPTESPSRKRQRVYGDRFIPNREGVDLQAAFSLLHDDASPATSSKTKKRTPHNELHFQRSELQDSHFHQPYSFDGEPKHKVLTRYNAAEEANRTFSTLLRAEIFESTIPQPTLQMSPDRVVHSSSTRRPDSTRSSTPPPVQSEQSAAKLSMTPSTPHKNLFSYMSPRHHHTNGQPTPSKTPRRGQPNMNSLSEIYSMSPVRISSQRMLLTPKKQPRHIQKAPFKVLDAPDLADDFYLNLVDWGSSDILGVGLGSCVYMWNSETQRVNKLCELDDDTVTSVSWIQRGSHIAIGTQKGHVQIWDANRVRRLRTMTGHTQRVGALAWNDHILTTGSRDRLIYHRDVRQPEQWLRKLVGHKQEVCGLKWNQEDGQLASGGNDNKLIVWDKLSDTPLWKFAEHTAAVKAIAWSPHQRNLLASGGGTADRKIMFHNTATGALINEIDTGSQVCNLAWSKNSNEIVSTHGYSQNQIVVWKYPSMTQVVSLTGHTYRVLYLAMSPDGRVCVTGAGDETLRFWNCFPRRDKGSGMGEVESLGRLGEFSVIR